MALHDLYKKQKDDEIIVWTSNDPEHEGFSVLRDYPPGCGFLPVKKPDGKNDTKVLIKTGFARSAVKDNKVALFVDAAKFELYLSGRFRYNFEDTSSPTKEAVDKSNQSLQPVPLQEHGRYIYDIKTQTIHDTQNKKEVSTNELVDTIYKLHVQTIRGRKGTILKGKITAQQWVCGKAVPKMEFGLKWFNQKCFGKDIVKNKDDWGEGLFRPIPHARLITLYPHTVPFFESATQISKMAVFWISLTILVGHYLLPERWALDSVSSIAAVILLVFVFDVWLPRAVLVLINILIRFRMWFGMKKFHFR